MQICNAESELMCTRWTVKTKRVAKVSNKLIFFACKILKCVMYVQIFSLFGHSRSSWQKKTKSAPRFFQMLLKHLEFAFFAMSSSNAETAPILHAQEHLALQKKSDFFAILSILLSIGKSIWAREPTMCPMEITTHNQIHGYRTNAYRIPKMLPRQLLWRMIHLRGSDRVCHLPKNFPLPALYDTELITPCSYVHSAKRKIKKVSSICVHKEKVAARTVVLVLTSSSSPHHQHRQIVAPVQQPFLSSAE